MEVFDNKYHRCSSISPCSSKTLAAPPLAEPPCWSRAVTHARLSGSPPPPRRPPRGRQGMRATTWRGAPGILPASAKQKKRKKKAPAPRGIMCGCGGTRSVSVDISALTTAPMRRGGVSTAAAPAGEPASAAKGCGRDADDGASAEGTPSVDSLLRQLQELEQGVRALGVREREGGGVSGSGSSSAEGTTATATTRPPRRPGHGRSASVVGRRLDTDSVAVVKESADPLGDFRRSMAQMIVEHGITGGAELRELLRRFLALNAACHHHLILRAFADVWDELFAAAGSAGHAVAPSHGSGGGRASKRPRGRADTSS